MIASKEIKISEILNLDAKIGLKFKNRSFQISSLPPSSEENTDSKSLILPLTISFSSQTQYNEFVKFPRGVVSVVIKDSSVFKVPGSEDDIFERPSLYVKYNNRYGFEKQILKSDRKRMIFSEKDVKKAKHQSL